MYACQTSLSVAIEINTTLKDFAQIPHMLNYVKREISALFFKLVSN